MNDSERDARFDAALLMMPKNPTENEIAALRKFAGTASSMYRPGWRFWNWMFDTEYERIGPAPVWWFVLGAAGVAIVFIVMADLLT